MADLRWTEQASGQRLDILGLIAEENVEAALALDLHIDRTVDLLITHPQLGRPGRVPGTRELVIHEHYLVVYEYDYDSEILTILTVLHASRQWPQG